MQTVDVDPLADSDLSPTLAFSSQDEELKSHEREAPHTPYPYYTDKRDDEAMVRRSLEFYQRMNKRRSVRKISDEAVPLEVIQNIVLTAGIVTCRKC